MFSMLRFFSAIYLCLKNGRLAGENGMQELFLMRVREAEINMWEAWETGQGANDGWVLGNGFLAHAHA